MNKKMLRKILSGLLVLCTVFSLNGFSNVFAAKHVAATKVSITNAVSVMAVGQSANFNYKLTPSNSTDDITWSTSDARIANPNAKGKFTAKKAGTVTITATATSGAKASVKVLVVSKNGVTSLQTRIDKMLDANNIKNVTIKNLETEQTYTIKEGDYSKKTLTVNAPLSEVVNSGKFKSIVIDDVKNGTFIEKASGNNFVIKDADAALKVEADAYVYSLDVQTEGGTLAINNEGKILKATVSQNAEVNVSGAGKVTNLVAQNDAKVSVGEETVVNKVTVAEGAKNVQIDLNGKVNTIVVKEATNLVLTGKSETVTVQFTEAAASSKLETAVPITVIANAEVGLVFNEGAEGSSVKTTGAEVDVKNNTTKEITVDKSGESTSIDSSIPTTTPTATPGAGGAGGSVIVTPTPTPTTNTANVTGTETADGKAAFTLPTEFGNLKDATVNVNVAGLSGTYSLTNKTLSYVSKLLAADATTIANWTKTTDRTIEKDGLTVNVTGLADSTVKTVEYRGVSFEVDVQGTSAADASIYVTKGSRTYVITKSSDNTTLYISSATGASAIIDMVTFTVTY